MSTIILDVLESHVCNRSVLGSDVMDFADTFDMGYVIKYNVHLINGCYIRLVCWLKVYQHVTYLPKLPLLPKTIEDRPKMSSLLINREMENVAHTRSEFSVAHALKQFRTNSTLWTSTKTSVFDHPNQQWIFCWKIWFSCQKMGVLLIYFKIM